MLNWDQLYKNLVRVSDKHGKLAAIFGAFAKLVEAQVNEPTFHIKGITTSLHLAQSYFTTTFAGRTILFLFTSLLESNGTLKGNVQCYLMKECPDPLHVKLGEFNFSGSGQTNLKMPDDGDEIIITIDVAALYVFLHFIHESLSPKEDNGK